MLSFVPKGTLPVFGQKMGFQVQPITEAEAHEILAAVARQKTDSFTVEDMIAWPQKAWYVGDVLGADDVHLYWGVWNTPTLTRVVVLEETNAELVT